MDSSFLLQVNKIIAQNLHKEKFKTRQLGRSLGMNHVSLNNKMKDLTGQSTGQYIRNYRLNKAKYLLQRTSLSIGEVASEVGVPEASNFIIMFKKAFGKSPGKWQMEKKKSS